ncbi:MAG TPA: alkaline phosphatase family protein [Candidatus Saccharimonadales bacterium]|jgi:phospholipase C|nr:alkaline phosphatase family protein [Candidatus Saccharimonadales bacterium]
MRLIGIRPAVLALMFSLVLAAGTPARAEGDPHKVKHIIVIMQENHSFDNYFGALAYAPGSPYHSPGREDRDERSGGCRKGDHGCVDGLTCRVEATGKVTCSNHNRDDNGSTVFAFHDPRRCVSPDLDHGWANTHREANFKHPNDTLFQGLMNGFVLINDQTEQIDKGESPTDDQAMAFYNQNEVPFYYELAQKFAINDRYFASVLGPTFPNRSYLLAATSFGHLTTSDSFPPPGGYKPITGTIFDLMEKNQVTWSEYFQDVPAGGSFRSFPSPLDPHFLPLPVFLGQLAGKPGLPPLPEVSFVDPNLGVLGRKNENDEHPPTDIQRGQAFVSLVVNSVRNSPFWKDSIIVFTYDEHGGFYDHVAPPRARQGHAPNPDGINPGQCADLSNPPLSLQPGQGAECSANLLSRNDTTVNDAADLCPEFAADPTGPFPAACANFDQYGIRVPFVVISPFSKPSYVSHTVGDHTSILALIEKVFMTPADSKDKDGGEDEEDAPRPHLTKRDQHASTLEDMFDFNRSPSLNTKIGVALPPAMDCTPK